MPQMPHTQASSAEAAHISAGQAGELLHKSEAALRLAQRLGHIGSWEWEIATDINSWSDQLYLIFGLEPTVFPPGFAAHERFYTAKSWATLSDAVAHALTSGAPYTLELEYIHSDGHTGWLEARGAVQRDESGRIAGLHGTIQVVTARHQLATARAETAELSRLKQQLDAEIARSARLEQALVQAQKLEVLGQLAGGIAHDFNNVLAAVSGSLQVLKMTAKDERSQTLVERGLRGTERATRLVRQLMGFARTQSIMLRTVDLAETLPGCHELLQLSAGAQVNVRMGLLTPCLVLTDPNQLEVALINLVINARDAMPEGGDMSIDLLPAPAVLAGPAWVDICVRDTGAGMPPDVLARALEPFFTTKPAGEGTGLGLAMVQAFARQSGGSLQIESRVGLGTCVSIRLPLSASATASALDAPEEKIDRSLHGRATILVVDDDPLVRPAIAHFLSDLLYTVHEADSGQRALDIARSGQPLDLVLTDVAMPGLNGPQMAAHLRVLRPGLPILMMTGNADRQRLAGEDVLDKPFTQAALGARVLALLGRAAAVAPRLAGRIKHPALLALYQRWRAHQTGTALASVAALDLPHCAAPEQVFVCQVVKLQPFELARTYVGSALLAHLGSCPDDPSSGNDDDHVFGGLEAAYRRCMRLREPSYEYLRFQLADGSSMFFERLLLPCEDLQSGSHQLVGMVRFENLLHR